MSANKTSRQSKTNGAKKASPRGVILFLWEILLVNFLCLVFLWFIEGVIGSANGYTYYSYFLFQILFPPILFGVVTWSTGFFRPGRILVALFVAPLALTPFFPGMFVVNNLWIPALCLFLAFGYSVATKRRPIRLPYRIRKRRPLPSDEELEEMMRNGRRIDRKYSSQRKYCRPIPLSRIWPIERI